MTSSENDDAYEASSEKKKQKTTRTANGESSIYKDAKGVWHGWVTLGVRPDGKLDRRHRMAKTRAEVLTKVRDLETSRTAGAVVPVGTKWTTKAWVTHWLEIKGDTLAPNTRRTYREHLDNWITPNVGNIPITQLQVEDVELIFAAMRKRHLSASSAERVRATLRAALNEAMRRSLVMRNVAKLAQVGFKTKNNDPARPLTIDQARKVTTAASRRPDAARWGLALLGMRPGEVFGLRWQDVNLDEGYMDLRQQIVRVYPFQHGCDPDDAACRARKGKKCPERIGGRMITGLKSEDSNRRIFLPPEILEQLRRHRTAQAKARLKAGPMWQNELWGDLVFTQSNGAPLDVHADRRGWDEVLSDALVDGRRLYDARHTAGTLLSAGGADIHQVKEQLGHSQITVTSRYYVHSNDQLQSNSANRLGNTIFDRPEPAKVRKIGRKGKNPEGE